MAEEGFVVKLHVYDLSQGLARQLSTTFLGKAIEAVWHTGLVVYGKEYYFSGGIQQDPAGTTPYGTPMRVVELGVTHLSMEVFEDYLQEISPRYTAETYNLLSHNCNNFTNEVAQFLVDTTIPDYILDLPNEVMNSPMGALILPMIQRLEATMKSGAVPQAPQFVPPVAAAQPVKQVNDSSSSSKVGLCEEASSEKATSRSSQEKVDKGATSALPAVKPVNVAEQKKQVAADPLGDARRRVQEEITREFASIMASGTLRASEAAALATRRVMERHSKLSMPVQQG